MSYFQPFLLTKVKKLYEDSLLPTQAHPDDAGYDIFVHHIEDKGLYIKVYSGLAIEPEPGYYFDLVPRSSIYKKGMMLYNSIGIIDNKYRGEILGIIIKTDDYEEPKPGDRLLQLIPKRQIPLKWEEVDVLDVTIRGQGGLGSTDKPLTM